MTHESGTLIPPEGWQAFFEEISRAYRGQRARVETETPDRGRQTVASDEPFGGLSVGDEEEGAVVIELGGGLSYSAGVPQSVRVEQVVGDPGQTITFAPADRPATLLHLAGGVPRGRAVGAAPGDDVAGVGGSAGAAGGSAAAGEGTSGGGGPDEATGGQVSFGSSDDMGGVAQVRGGSFGDQDLSGRRSYDISADVYDAPTLEPMGGAGTHAGSGSETSASGAAPISTAEDSSAVGQRHLHPDVIDGGSGQGVLDTGVDPIAGGPVIPGTDADDDMVEGEVGAQAEGDLEERIREDAEQSDSRREEEQ